MSLISSTIPNLVNGVSQQPFALRLASQSEDQVNTFPSVVEGLKKRPPTNHVARLSETPFAPNGAAFHTINRDTNERYIVVLMNGDLKVYDINGNEKLVNFAVPSKSYLNSTNPERGFSVVTVADYSFIVNKEIAVQKSTDRKGWRRPEGMVYISQGNYDKSYSLYVDDQWICSYKTPNGSEAGHSFWIGTDIIADRLMQGAGTNDPGIFTGTPLLQSTWLDATRRGSVITIWRKDNAEFRIASSDGFGGKAMRVFRGSVQRFSDLPSTDVFPDFHLEVVGDQSSNFDNYYVKYDTGTTNSGVWRETTAQDVEYKFNSATMPHLLVRNADGTFTFKAADWAERMVGDNDSAPWPSFVGRAITDVFFHRNRLGFVSDENVIFSRAGEFFNFWPTTVTAVLDTDPIDVAVANTKVSILNYAVPFNEDLLLFSDQTQFALTASDLLTPNTVAINQTTEFETSRLVRPIGAGRNIYFAVNRGKWTGIREFFVSDDTDTNDALDITSHVPKYIPGNVVKMAAATNEDMLVVLSANKRDSLFIYKYYFSADEKLQSSWSRWDFGTDATILNVDFIESTLYLLVSRPTGVFIEAINVELGSTDLDAPFLVHLDRKCRVTPTQDLFYPEVNVGGSSFMHLPYKFSTTLMQQGTPLPFYGVVAEGQRVKAGTVVPLFSSGNSTTGVYARGNWVGVKLIIGYPYLMTFTFSTITLREEAVGGGQATIGSGRLQLRRMLLNYANSGFFKTIVTPKGRDPSVTVFSGSILGDADTKLGQANVSTGRFSFPIQSRNTDVEIRLESDKHLPVAIMSAEWEGLYNSRSQRLT